ncbi:MAG TPA: mechanosensitive ion channel domain-containing protein [Actinomycetota bacterium]|nr:mechanosensitive ion channel domain-containing protein [Actinomycetota bacterium]
MVGINAAWPSRVLAAATVVLVAVLVELAVRRLLPRMVEDHKLAEELNARCRWPTRAVAAFAVLRLVLSGARLPPSLDAILGHVLLIGLVVSGAWLAERAVRVAEDALMRRFESEAPSSLRARRVRTQVRVLGRVVTAAIIVVAVATVLLTFPQGRAIGASLLASAGIAGIVAGVAARSTVGNFIAGLQIAIAEPIRLDDAVVVEGEWGNIEEITLTYVVVRIWDQRRLVLPSSYFIEQPIENWTRYSADIVGTVVLYVDYATPVDDVRAEFERVVATSELWNRKTAILQVVDATERTMVLRALVSADSAQAVWDLRADVRERLLAWMRRAHPEALPRVRAELPSAGPAGSAEEEGPPAREAASRTRPARRGKAATPVDEPASTDARADGARVLAAADDEGATAGGPPAAAAAATDKGKPADEKAAKGSSRRSARRGSSTLP